MVFISMNCDEFLNRTAQYQIQYVPARYHSRYLRGGFERGELDPIITVRHNEDGTTVTTASRRHRRPYGITGDDGEEGRRLAEMPSEFTNTIPPFRITTECSDDEESDNDSPRTTRRPPNRIGSLPFESDGSEDGNPFEYGFDDFETYRRVRRDAEAAAEVSQQDSVRATGGELMTPHAKFFIEKDKSKCTLRFDPPVSGRFILLKMWSPHLDPSSNIDIQAVIARGFAGPRYFPSVQVR
jgi:hypothetical protein